MSALFGWFTTDLSWRDAAAELTVRLDGMRLKT
jgi:hypothetical protein